MSLKYPYLLILIPLVLIILWHARKSKHLGKKLFFPIVHRGFAHSKASQLPVWVPYIIRALAFTFLIYCLARPQTSSSHVRRLAEGIDIMISLDVSKSMVIEDELGKDRLSVAKKTIHKFISGRTDDRIGFMMFAGEGVTLCPPTLDYEIVQRSVESADLDTITKDGTAIGDALAISADRLKNSTAKSRIIILVTDGDNNMGSIAPLTAGDIAAGYGIKVYSIALGKDGVVNMPDESPDIFGNTQKVYRQVKSTINPSLLIKISEETGGKFYRAEDEGSLSRVFDDINKLEKTKIETKDRVHWEEQFQKYLLIAILFLILDIFLRKTIYRVLPE